MFRAVLEQCNTIIPSWCSTYFCLKVHVLAPPAWYQCPIAKDNAESVLQNTFICKPRSLYRYVSLNQRNKSWAYKDSQLSILGLKMRFFYLLSTYLSLPLLLKSSKYIPESFTMIQTPQFRLHPRKFVCWSNLWIHIPQKLFVGLSGLSFTPTTRDKYAE